MLSSEFSLTPLTTGQVLDRAFRLYRRNFLTFVGIIALVPIITSLMNAIALVNPSLVILSSLGGIVAGLFNVLVTAALARAVASSYMGQPLRVGQAYQQISSHIAALFLLILVSIGLGIALVIWTIIPCVGWLTGPGMIFFFSLASALIGPIIVIENVSVGQALRRAWDLTRRRFWPTIGFGLVLSLLAQLIVTGPTALVILGVGTVMDNPTTAGWVQVASTLLISIVFTPFQLTAYVLYYFDLRVRNEGLDIELSGQSMEGQNGMALLAQAPAAKTDGLITSEEVGQFVILTLIFAAIVVVLGLLSGGLAALFAGL